ncbi:hypothetical protein ACJRO7_014763 [Eucalyptus globulus]|uniref:non-specific serine/threonine protein kinase n=1 Tax=Eucalyptus globulus TaxID=34317 RepID=A0ABD3L194_EUCGL
MKKMNYRVFDKKLECVFSGNEGKIDGRRSIGKIDLSGKKIGEGSNGTTVVEGRHEERPAAVKCVGQVHCHVADNEINILKKTGPYKNIVRFYGEERDQDFVYLALELCTCSLYDLFQAYSNSSNNPRPLTKNKKINNPRSPDGPASKKYSESKLASDGNTVRDVDLRWVVGHRSTSLLKLMRDVVFGLEQLHGLEIIHLDLNPTNILITQNPFGAKLSGMGTSIYLPDGQSSSGYHATSCGTKGWQAPELFHDEGGQTQAMDLFSLGCVLFFCITCGRHLFGENNVSTNPDLFLVEDMPEAHDLISRLLRQDPKSRPRASEVLHHPFFWSSKRRLTFLHDVSEKIKSEDEKGNSDFMKNLEVTVQPIFKGRWDKIIDPKIMVHLRRFATYDGRRVKSLLRAVRNKVNHHQEAPEEVEKIHGRFPDGLDAYFAKKFPRLLIESYTVAYEVCKNDPHLEEYFLFGELK